MSLPKCQHCEVGEGVRIGYCPFMLVGMPRVQSPADTASLHEPLILLKRRERESRKALRSRSPTCRWSKKDVGQSAALGPADDDHDKAGQAYSRSPHL